MIDNWHIVNLIDNTLIMSTLWKKKKITTHIYIYLVCIVFMNIYIYVHKKKPYLEITRF